MKKVKITKAQQKEFDRLLNHHIALSVSSVIFEETCYKTPEINKVKDDIDILLAKNEKLFMDMFEVEN